MIAVNYGPHYFTPSPFGTVTCANCGMSLPLDLTGATKAEEACPLSMAMQMSANLNAGKLPIKRD